MKKVVIDSPEEFEKIKSFFGGAHAEVNLRPRVVRWRRPIFDHYGQEVEISRALQPKVGLKSGGNIVIEQTEALIAIDVTPAVCGQAQPEDKSENHLEASAKLLSTAAAQLGVILVIIDFIDMEKEANRDKVSTPCGNF
jgi:ribonuclease G